MSMSDEMWMGARAVDGVLEGIRYYLSPEATTFDYKSHTSGDFAEAVEADLVAVRRRMTAYEGAFGVGSLTNTGNTAAMPEVITKIIAARAMVEQVLGVTVPDGIVGSGRSTEPKPVEAGHWQRLVAERGIDIDAALDWEPTDEETAEQRAKVEALFAAHQGTSDV